MTMEIDDLYNDPLMIRRWELIDGRPQCPLEAILATDAGALAALQRNAAVRSMVAEVEAYEAEPTDDAPAAIVALAQWRAAEPVSADAGHSAADDDAEAAGAPWEAARDAALAELDARAALPLDHDPRPTPHLSFLAFMALFTPAEQMAIVGSTETRVRLFCLMASGAAYVDMAHPDVIAGVQYLAALGLIDAARVPAILAAQPPA